MFMIEENINEEVVTTPLPNLPAAGEVAAKQAIGHLDPRTGLVLLDRVLTRSEFGAERYGEAWRSRDNCQELVEETTDAVVYGAQEIARLSLGLTPLIPGNEPANQARDLLSQSLRHAAMADHCAQMAQAVIQGTTLKTP